MTNKLGGDSAFPNTYDADRFRGLTYRQWLAGQIAGHMLNDKFIATCVQGPGAEADRPRSCGRWR